MTPVSYSDPSKRVHRSDPSGGFVAIQNSLAQDAESLSAQAFGMLVRMLSRPADWRFTAESLTSQHHGKASVASMLAELEDAGFLLSVRRRNEAGKFGGVEYHVFDRALTEPEREQIIADLTATRSTGSGEPGAGLPGPGKSEATNTEENKDRRDTEEGKSNDLPAPHGVEDEDSAIAAYEAQLAAQDGKTQAGTMESPSKDEQAQETQSLAMSSEDEPNGKDFPWRQVMGALKRICPEIPLPTNGERRDFFMRRFWKDGGKTIGCFERLAEAVHASDFVMARNGHKGNNGKPYSWGWIFSKREKDWKLRANLILEGAFSNEAMAFVLEKKAEAALTLVMRPGSSQKVQVDMAEKHNGEPRYKIVDTHANGLPVVVDYKG